MNTRDIVQTIFKGVAKGFLSSVLIAVLLVLGGAVYLKAFTDGYTARSLDAISLLGEKFSPGPVAVLGVSDTNDDFAEEEGNETPIPTVSEATEEPPTSFPGNSIDLWSVINQRRQIRGVNTLTQSSELCTIAEIRINELIALGSLDGHAGFTSLLQKRPDLKPIFESYASVSEFLLFGTSSAQEAVSLWEGAPEHSKLVTSNSYTYGCVQFRNSFAVAITAR